MDYLKAKILSDGVVKKGNVLKVDSFLNHQMDVRLYNEIGKEFYRLFGDCNVTKILTIEASGIGIACVTAQSFNYCPVVFAKKSKTSNVSDSVYTSQVESFTHGNVNTVIVSKEYIKPEDRILIIDDFLANGAALTGLIDIVGQAGATVVGAGIVIEKGFQDGGKMLREKGYRIESLAIIDSMNDETGEIVFRD
ncbi:MAG: xanthine phosphoribosyltransferase [Clostridiaceae bacterium]|nr:xanthine phosphoribosyltransferase [Clostridiaceae bacterium]